MGVEGAREVTMRYLDLGVGAGAGAGSPTVLLEGSVTAGSAAADDDDDDVGGDGDHGSREADGAMRSHTPNTAPR